jgi:hypothetical protein
MVKEVSSKPIKTVKSHDTKKHTTAATPNANESDDEQEYTDCVAEAAAVDGQIFDEKVDRCFIVLDVGSSRKVKCGEGEKEVQKDVYNVNLTTPLGEIIQLTAWGDYATNVYDFFRSGKANYILSKIVN